VNPNHQELTLIEENRLVQHSELKFEFKHKQLEEKSGFKLPTWPRKEWIQIDDCAKIRRIEMERGNMHAVCVSQHSCASGKFPFFQRNWCTKKVFSLYLLNKNTTVGMWVNGYCSGVCH